MSRPANPPEVHIPPRHGKSALTGMFGDPDSWDALHNDVDGAAVSVPDDPATLRARLEERYERPERPCTYDPADEEPEAEPVAPTPEDRLRSHLRALAHESQRADDWTPPRPEPVEYSGLPFTIHPDGSRWGRPLGTKDKPGGFMTYGEMRKQDDATLPPGTVRAALERTVRDASTHTKEDPMPTTTIIDRAILEEVARDLPKSYASVTGWTNQIVEDPSNGPRMDRSVAKFMERVRSAALLRSYLRTLTNPDATPEGVNAALDALTPEDRALVSEALPSWGSARMVRFEAIAPFMDRFKTMVRERDPRAQEEGTLLLSALREDDPTRSTIETLMEIAKTPRVNP